MLKSIEISGLLSFAHAKLDLKPLNVLIGPNGSGKSNLIEVISLLHATTMDLQAAMRRAGGVSEWFWKGEGSEKFFFPEGAIKVIITLYKRDYKYSIDLEYREDPIQAVLDEFLIGPLKNGDDSEAATIFEIKNGNGKILERKPARGATKLVYLDIEQGMLNPGDSIFRGIKVPTHYRELHELSSLLESIRFHREWSLGRKASPRSPQPTDASRKYLEEDASNLVLVLNSFTRDRTIKRVEDELREFYENAERIDAEVVGNTAQLFLMEKGLKNSVPATRLSDGTIRYLCLLAILLHPDPPPLVCIEEPELGLHPDVLPRVAELMKEASERMQLIVTTHSDILIDALSDTTESVVVCERSLEDGGTEFHRLEPDKLSEWLEEYRLGELWRRNEIGGNRW
jgi:predicted ATPase